MSNTCEDYISILIILIFLLLSLYLSLQKAAGRLKGNALEKKLYRKAEG